MSIHRWVEEDGIGLMVAFDEEPTEEALDVFRELARWIAAEQAAGRNPLRGTHLEPAAKLTEAEAAEPPDRQMQRILELRRRAGLDS